MKKHHEHEKSHKAGGGYMEKHHKASGGSMEYKDQETPEYGSREWEEDEKDKPEARDNAKKIDDEAEERKHGGKAKKKVGGALVKKKVHGGVIKKNVGGVTGSAPKASAARAPRKSGGRTGSDGNPFSSARAGTAPKRHKMEMDID